MTPRRTNKDRLIEAAARLFAEQGYHGTSLHDLLSATSVSRSNFYYHFDSKAELARAVVASWTAWRERTLLDRAVGGNGTDPLDRLRHIFEAAERTEADGPDRWAGALGRLGPELATVDAEAGARVAEHLDTLRSGLRQAIADALPRGDDEYTIGELTSVALAVLEGSLVLSALPTGAPGPAPTGAAFVALVSCLGREPLEI